METTEHIVESYVRFCLGWFTNSNIKGKGGKEIDILAIDSTGVPVVVELKVSKGYERVIGQSLYYRSRIKKIFSADRVRIIIIAREITENLKSAVEDLPDVQLFEYSLSIKLNMVS